MNGKWFVFGFVTALALVAVLEKCGVVPSGDFGWWFIPILAVLSGLRASIRSCP